MTNVDKLPSLTPHGLAWFWHRKGPNPNVSLRKQSWNFQNRCTYYDSDVESVTMFDHNQPFEEQQDSYENEFYWEEEENEWGSELDLYDDCDYEPDL